MEKTKIIESQAEEIAELKEKLDYAKKSVDLIYRQYYEEKERADKLEEENRSLNRAAEVVSPYDDKKIKDYIRARLTADIDSDEKLLRLVRDNDYFYEFIKSAYGVGSFCLGSCDVEEDGDARCDECILKWLERGSSNENR